MIKRYNSFNESKKDKFPSIQKKEYFGYTIFIGRDAKSNDYLTFNVADKEDISSREMIREYLDMCRFYPVPAIL
jgi:predicted ribosome quality control (RQC) complex YloA/Tae2 family protein